MRAIYAGATAALFRLLAMAVLIIGFTAPSVAQTLTPVSITIKGGQVRTFQIEIADTPEAREKGLMFRESMPLDQGMLFVFDREAPVAFWMKNTLIPLDMLFIRADGTIINIYPMARPHDETPIPARAPVRYVLEINGGVAAMLGIRAGDKVTLPKPATAP